MDTIAERLRFVRGNLSREKFALAIGVHKNTIGRYERGESEPDLTTASSICRAFHVTPEWLILGQGTPPDVSNTETRPYYYTHGSKNAFLVRERGTQDPTTEENIQLLTDIVQNLVTEMEIPLAEENALAVANLYYTEMKIRLAHFAKELAKLSASRPQQ